MATRQENPYLGRTQHTARPTLRPVESRSMSADDLRAAQSQWDDAERTRLEQIAARLVSHEALTRDDIAEEPESKAFENRLRVAFLATKGATMIAWNQERAAILKAARKRASADG